MLNKRIFPLLIFWSGFLAAMQMPTFYPQTLPKELNKELFNYMLAELKKEAEQPYYKSLLKPDFEQIKGYLAMVNQEELYNQSIPIVAKALFSNNIIEAAQAIDTKGAAD